MVINGKKYKHFSLQVKPSASGGKYLISYRKPNQQATCKSHDSLADAQRYVLDSVALMEAEEAFLAEAQAQDPLERFHGTSVCEIIDRFESSPDCRKRNKSMIKSTKRLAGTATVKDLRTSWIKEAIVRGRSYESQRNTPFAFDSIAGFLSIIHIAVVWEAERLDIAAPAFVVKDKYFQNVSLREGGDGQWKKERDRRLEEGEYEALLAAFDSSWLTYKQHFVLLVRFAVATGARLKEMVMAKWSEISPAGISWNIPKHKTKPRKQMLTDEAMAILAELKTLAAPDQKRIFHTIPSPSHISKNFRTYTKRAGMVDFVFHDLRHEGITRLVASQRWDPERLMTMVGHSTLKMLRRYTNMREHELERLMVRGKDAPRALHASLDMAHGEPRADSTVSA